jgi:hypothetical protein
MAYDTQLRSQGAPLRSDRPVVRPAIAAVHFGARSAAGVELPRRGRAALLMWTSKVAAQFVRRRPRLPVGR